jgi:hypothetical protein
MPEGFLNGGMVRCRSRAPLPPLFIGWLKSMVFSQPAWIRNNGKFSLHRFYNSMKINQLYRIKAWRKRNGSLQ